MTGENIYCLFYSTYSTSDRYKKLVSLQMRASYVNPAVIKEKCAVKEYNDGT